MSVGADAGPVGAGASRVGPREAAVSTLLLALLFFGGIPLAFTGYHMGQRRPAVGRDVRLPSTAAPGKDVSVVGIAQPWQPAGISPVTQQPVLWVRARRSWQGRKGSGGSQSIGKLSTAFLLVDGHDPRWSVTVDSNAIRDLDVRVRRRYADRDGRVLTAPNEHPIISASRHVSHRSGLEEAAIYPGDELWVHGPLEDLGGYLGFGKRAWIDDRPPETRSLRHTNFAIVGGVATAFGVALALVGTGVGWFG